MVLFLLEQLRLAAHCGDLVGEGVDNIYIRVNNPTLNNKIGKFNLSHIWDRVLLNTKGLTLNNQGNNNNSS